MMKLGYKIGITLSAFERCVCWINVIVCGILCSLLAQQLRFFQTAYQMQVFSLFGMIGLLLNMLNLMMYFIDEQKLRDV
jgi:hypothetical protein